MHQLAELPLLLMQISAPIPLRRCRGSRGSHRSFEDLERHGAAVTIQRRWRARHAQRSRDALGVTLVLCLAAAGDASDAACLLELVVHGEGATQVQGAVSMLVRWGLLQLASETHLDALASGALGGFVSALVLGTAAGLATRSGRRARTVREVALGAVREAAAVLGPAAPLAAALVLPPLLDEGVRRMRRAARGVMGAEALGALAAADVVLTCGIEAALDACGMEAVGL